MYTDKNDIDNKDHIMESPTLITIHEKKEEEKVLNNDDMTISDLSSKINENNQILQSENLIAQAKEDNLINNEIYSETNIITSDAINNANETNSSIFLQATHDKTSHLEVATESQAVDTEKIEDTESINSLFYYNWSITPKLICTGTEEYKSTELYENFTKGCQWSPDGTCLLVPAEDFRIRLYDLPTELYNGKIPSDFTQTAFTPTLTVKEGGLIYDAYWYPFMNSWDPVTCCFLTASQESPIHLWDAFTGMLRATYRPYNQVDEVEAPTSVQFVNYGKEIWCGFKNTARMFDTERPGRQINNMHFKHDFPNMSGLVSCIRENPIMPGLVAFGTYSKCIGLYKDGPLCVFKTKSGVTQIEFSSCGMKLFSAVRRNSEFLCWDLRNPGTVLYSFAKRQSDTNQRIQFAITPDNKQIISGGIDGNITMWEIPENAICNEDFNPKYKLELSKDCINGISLHRSLPIIATSSGQRQCTIENKQRDNSVRLWWAS